MEKTSKEIQAGDVVTLNSSPEIEMTVGSIDESAIGLTKYGYCLWFDDNQTIHEQRLPLKSLSKVMKKASSNGGGQ